MKRQDLSGGCKIEESEDSMIRERVLSMPSFIFGKSLYNHQVPYCPNITLNPLLPYRRRRNANLRLKLEPSDQKMKKIDEKRGRYKRSTNNSHKKYTAVAKRLLLKYMSEMEIQRFESVYEHLKNSRSYYFIILAHAKYLLDRRYIQDIREGFFLVMNNKIDFYRKETEKTNNRNFITFRMGEIAEIEFALRAFDLYFDGYVDEAVEVIYKKDKNIIIKKNQYEQTIQIIKELESQLASRRRNPVQRNYQSQPYQAREITHQNLRVKQEERRSSEEYDSQDGQPQNRPTNKDTSLENLDPNKKYPILSLQNSYPYFQSFFPVVFSYQNKSAPIPSMAPLYSQMQFIMMEEERERMSQPFVSSMVGSFKSFREEPFVLTHSK